jgi:radical SAM protein with 4Fe4S-binding SPASM domain
VTATRELAGDRLTIGAAFCVFDVNVDEIETAAAKIVEARARNYLEVRPVFPTEWRGGGFARALSRSRTSTGSAQARLDAARDAANSFQVIGMIQRFDALKGAERGFSACHIGPLTTVINADGYIYHCCIQRGMPNFRAGSVLEKPFKEVWWNAQHQQMVGAIDVSKCPPCRYDGYNRLIQEAFMGDALHADAAQRRADQCDGGVTDDYA